MTPEGVEYLLVNFAGWLLILILVAICIYPTIRLNGKMVARFPERQPFAWGYFNGLLLMLAGVVTVGFLFSDIFDTKGEKKAALVFAVLIFVLGLMIYRRNRWAWLVYVVVSLNPISWIINGIYLKNRWKEMKEDDQPIVRALATYWTERSTSSRVLFAGAIFWAACVLAFIILFTGPNDDIRHDFTQMISVIIVPPALAWFGRFLWRIVLKPENLQSSIVFVVAYSFLAVAAAGGLVVSAAIVIEAINFLPKRVSQNQDHLNFSTSDFSPRETKPNITIPTEPPAKQAEVDELGRQTGPAPRDFKEREDDLKRSLREEDINQVIDNFPGTRRFFENPDNAAKAKDEFNKFAPLNPLELDRYSGEQLYEAALQSYICSFLMHLAQQYEKAKFLRRYSVKLMQEEQIERAGKNWNDVNFPGALIAMNISDKHAGRFDMDRSMAAARILVEDPQCKILNSFSERALKVE